MTGIGRALAAPRPRVPAPARVLLAVLARLAHGSLEITTPDTVTRVFGPGGAPGPAVLRIGDWAAAGAALRGGDVGFAEGYMAGHWDTPDLAQLLTVLAANQSALERVFYGRFWARALLRLRHLCRANTKRQAKRNIAAHYDLGNAFYALWLDPTMTYSAACFDGDRARSLEDAQIAKYDRMLAALGLRAPSRILEMGCGWGGLCERAARAGHHVTGISLSNAQTGYARERLARAGLAADLRVQDYRDLRGTFDAVASVEMIEAVGERYWPAYFRAVRAALVPGGRACIQAITIAVERFARYRAQSDFIQQYIFPGGMLASPARLTAEAARAGLDLVAAHTFGRDYVETLARWAAAFDAALPAIRAQGFDERFIRCWRFYLAYCTAGFATRTTDVGQYTFVAT
ncbi:MAG: class I SAM-dependent methyltransferase [Burkholderiales bacterium]|nr:class I SAM-dependent methyltransferase [Burkholderiales bacterium]